MTLPVQGPSLRKGPKITMFMGGTGGASIARKILGSLTWDLTIAVPTTDDGGSTRKIVDLVGGPAIGDFRSILVRIGDANLTGHLNSAEHPTLDFLHHRLAKDSKKAVSQWKQILEGNNSEWRSIPDEVKPIIRRELISFELAIKSIGRPFDFAGACIGNLLLTGARMSLNSFGGAIDLFKYLLRLPYETVLVPSAAMVHHGESHHLGCELENGDKIYGQNEISHPGSFVVKDCDTQLSAPIDRAFFYAPRIDAAEPDEISIPAHPRLLNRISRAEMILYSAGSFWTSIMPSLITTGVKTSIAQRAVPKVMMLNGWSDRETMGMSALRLVEKLAQARQPADLISDLVYVEGTTIPVDSDSITKKLGIDVTPISANSRLSSADRPVYDTDALMSFLEHRLA